MGDPVPQRSVVEAPWHGRALRTPRQDFAVLADPSLPASIDVARQNHAALLDDLDLQGRTLARMREWTRDEVLSAARDYTAELLNATATGDVTAEPELAPVPSTDLLFVAGHQPAMYHPGVWAKNFAVHEMAARTGGLSLNLSVDTDLMSGTSIRVPERSAAGADPRIERVAFDADRPRGPWEENPILDRSLFESFGERVCDKMAAWQVNPVLREQWSDAIRATQRFTLLRDCLIASRLRLERRWGVTNLELPISRMCELEPFLWFASHILAHLPRFVAVHNQVLAEYRQVNHIRSRTHPVPELKSKGDCFEAPFWVWRKGDSVRSRVFARQVGREIVLSDGKAEFARVRLTPDCEACCAVEVLRKLPEQGIRLRARALTTTLFSRLCLADLFVHGIGGAKYDEMTDRIMARFMGVTPPGFLTLTASLYLPLAENGAVTPEDESRRVRLLRDLRWNADRHLDAASDAETRELMTQKSALVAALRSVPERAELQRNPKQSRLRFNENFERFRQMQEINRRLADKAAPLSERTFRELSLIRRGLATHSLLHDREFAFSLYPEDRLRRLMGSLFPSH
ncbi:MAG TPA: hypothetical protein VGP63_21910 [Planctomycetaceae bacterium]|nr:hypothetical protein [Planctomycetaceae bacterium]